MTLAVPNPTAQERIFGMTSSELVEYVNTYFRRDNKPKDYCSIPAVDILVAFGYAYTFDKALSELRKIFAQRGYWVSLCGLTGSFVYVGRCDYLPKDSFIDNKFCIKDLLDGNAVYPENVAE